MQNTASLYRASDSLARSHLVAAETDQIGTEIIDDLTTQRESLMRTRDTVCFAQHEACLYCMVAQTYHYTTFGEFNFASDIYYVCKTFAWKTETCQKLLL